MKKEFTDSLSLESKAKYSFIADLLEESGIGVKEPYVKPLAGTKNLFEILIKDKSNIHRILSLTFTGRKFVLLHGFTKKERYIFKSRAWPRPAESCIPHKVKVYPIRNYSHIK